MICFIDHKLTRRRRAARTQFLIGGESRHRTPLHREQE
jgi:hypothetical protein